jgi:hypothetical protein
MLRSLLFACLVVVNASSLIAQSKVFEQTVNLSPGGSLRLQARRGSVRLTGWDRNQVEVRARIEAEGSWNSGDARRAVDATTIEVNNGFGTSVSIRANYDNIPWQDWIFSNGRSHPNIHYEIRAPRRVDLRLEIDRSPAHISGFDGRIDLDASRSEVDAADLTGSMRITLERGDNSSFRNLRGSFDIEAQRTNLRIDLARLDASSSVEIQRGDIDMSVARSQGFNLDTSLGRRADFDSSIPLQVRSSRQTNPSGPVNGGGPRLSIQADRGRVRLR